MEKLSNPIFIGGCGSSGTTLLRKMLNMHPNIAAGPELSVFDRPELYSMDMNMFYTLWRNEDFEVFDKDCMINIRVNPGNKSYFAFNRDQYHKPEEWEKFFDDTESCPAEFFDRALSEYARKQGKKRWCEKTPNNIFEVEKIFETFPDGKFIEVIRDGRDVVLSLVQRRRARLPDAVYRWITSIKSGYSLVDDFWCDGDLMNVKYEDLVKRPASVLKKVCNFLDEEYDPIMLKYWQKKYNSEAEANDLGYGKKPVFTSSIGKWKREGVSPTFIRGMQLSIYDILKDLGYKV